MMRNHKGRSIPNHQPAAYREKLPPGVHQRAVDAGYTVLKQIPTARRNFEKLQMKNNPLATFVLSRVHKKYKHETTHYRVAVNDVEKKERYRQQAMVRVTQLVGQGFVANRVLNELKITNFSPSFVDAILRDKVIRVSEAKTIAKKLSELENINRRMAKETRLKVQSILSAPLTHAEKRQKTTLYRNAAQFVDRQIMIARFPKK